MSEPAYQPTDRRPIRARSTSWAAAISAWLVRAGISPNAISMAGMGAALLAGLLLVLTAGAEGAAARFLWLVAVLLVQTRLLCNLFDGMVAVASDRASPVGELYNEVPDRVADAAVLIGLGYAAGGVPALGYTAACVALFVAYTRAMAKASGAPNDFCGPLAKPQRMFVVTITGVYMALAPATWHLAWGPDGAWGIASIALAVIAFGGAVTAMRRLSRAARSLRKAA